MLSSGVKGVTLAAQYSHAPPLLETEPTAAVGLRPAGPPPTSAHVRERRTRGDMAGAKAAHPALLEPTASALERLPPPPAATVDLSPAEAFVWEARGERLPPVPRVAGVPYDLL